MIDFVGTPPFLRITLWVAMVTMHSLNRFILGEHCFFLHSGYSREQFCTNEKLSSRGVQGRSN